MQLENGSVSDSNEDLIRGITPLSHKESSENADFSDYEIERSSPHKDDFLSNI